MAWLGECEVEELLNGAGQKVVPMFLIVQSQSQGMYNTDNSLIKDCFVFYLSSLICNKEGVFVAGLVWRCNSLPAKFNFTLLEIRDSQNPRKAQERVHGKIELWGGERWNFWFY